jgi:YhcH/YjgK/YiaL family protein
MILDTLQNRERYYALSPRLRQAFEWLDTADIASLEVGRHDIDGDNIFVNVSELELRPRSAAALEVHNEYIDIQVVFGGEEEFGWSPRSELKTPREEFDTERDIQFFLDTPQTFYSVREGQFTILLPEDAHAPMLGSGHVRKLIFKVRR